MKQIKYTVAYVIYNENKTKFLIVKRPTNDKDLPNLWGLPAGSAKEYEKFEEAVIRSGREKLGVELKIKRFIGRGVKERKNYILHLEEFEAEITNGTPKTPQPIEGITKYTSWRWGEESDLKKPRAGVLCAV